MADENDDLGADIEAAIAASSGGAPDAPASAPVVESAPEALAPAPEAPKGDQSRAADGKFAPKAETPAAKVEGAAIPQTPAAPVPAQAAQQPASQPIAAPQNWKGAGKVQWDKLPPAVRQEIAEDYTRLNETSAKLEKLNGAIGQDRAMTLAATYGSVEQGLQNLFSISDMATKNPTGFVLWFMQQRGLNPAQMFGQQSAQGEMPMQQAPDPVMQRMAQLETFVQSFAQQQQQGVTAQHQGTIEAFAADPAHPYFNDVRQDMGVLIQAGRAKDLQQAYDMAVWAHPEIRNTLIEGQVTARNQAQAQTVSQALNASVSVSGSPAGAKVANSEPDETLEETITRAVRAHSS